MDAYTGPEMRRIVIRTALDDFEAFKVAEAVCRTGGRVITVTVSPVMVFDHLHGHQRPDLSGRQMWIVWAEFDATFNPNDLDVAILKEQ